MGQQDTETVLDVEATDKDSSKDPAAIVEVLDASEVEDEDDMLLQTGWHTARTQVSLPEAHASIKMPSKSSPWRMLLAFAGCGTIISVGYM